MTSIPVSKFSMPITTALGYDVFAINVGNGHVVGRYLGADSHEHTELKNVQLGVVEESHRDYVERRLSELKYRGPYKFISY